MGNNVLVCSLCLYYAWSKWICVSCMRHRYLLVKSMNNNDSRNADVKRCIYWQRKIRYSQFLMWSMYIVKKYEMYNPTMKCMADNHKWRLIFYWLSQILNKSFACVLEISTPNLSMYNASSNGKIVTSTPST